MATFLGTYLLYQADDKSHINGIAVASNFPEINPENELLPVCPENDFTTIGLGESITRELSLHPRFYELKVVTQYELLMPRGCIGWWDWGPMKVCDRQTTIALYLLDSRYTTDDHALHRRTKMSRLALSRLGTTEAERLWYHDPILSRLWQWTKSRVKSPIVGGYTDKVFTMRRLIGETCPWCLILSSRTDCNEQNSWEQVARTYQNHHLVAHSWII